MRKGWRNVVAAVGLLAGSLASHALARTSSGGSEASVRLTVEIAWTAPVSSAVETGEVELELSEGQVVEAVAWPDGPAPALKSGRVWGLGSDRGGRVRARIEAPLGAGLLIRAGGQALRFPVSLILEGAQKTPSQAPVAVTVERLAWDVIAVDLPENKGLVAPGSTFPVSVGFHVLTPEPGAVDVRCQAELRPVRGGEPVWQGEIRQVAPTNAAECPSTLLQVKAPEAEGTYVLELHASWEPAPSYEGNKLLRLIRRGKRGLFGTATASRKVTLAVLSADSAKPVAGKPGRDLEVDLIDLSKVRGHRPSASGRSPLALGGRGAWAVPEEALAEPTRRDRLRGWITRSDSEVVLLGPADGAGLTWSALGLKVVHPGRPHRLTLTVAGGHPSALGVAVVGVGVRPRLLLDACASGPPILPDGAPAKFNWLVWPDSADPVLLLVNRAGGVPVHVASVSLSELADLPPGPVVEPPGDAPARGLGLYLTGRDLTDRFGGQTDSGLADGLLAARNLGAYLAHCGTSAVVLPEGLADRPKRRALEGFAAEDATGPDRLDTVIQMLGRRKIAAWLELSFAGALPGLPPAGSADSLARGLVRLDRRGLDEGAVYHPLNQEVGDAMRKHVIETIAAHHDQTNLAGLLVRLGPGPTLLGSPDTGFDDATFARFVRDAFDQETAKNVPGRANDDPGRFAARATFLAGSGRVPWLTWRSKRVAALYQGFAAAAQESEPRLSLAVATPGPDDGPAGIEARRADLAGLAPSLAWRAVGLDLDAWPSGEADHAPIVLRGVALGADELSHDLATSPELDAKVAARPPCGLFLGIGGDLARDPATPGPSATVPLVLRAAAINADNHGDEPLGHALAALDARWVWLAASHVSGQEERLRRFARVFRSLPAGPPAEHPAPAFGVAVRAYRASGQTYISLANDTPYPVRLDALLEGPTDAPVQDLGRGARLRPEADAAGRHLVLDLLPFGTAAVRVGSPETRVAGVTPYPSETVLTGMQARYEALSAQLSRITRGGDRREKEKAGAAPTNPGFEPEPAPHEVAMRIGEPTKPADQSSPEGWQVVGGMGQSLVIDLVRPHSGLGALRLDSPTPPGAALSNDFVPNIHSAMLVRAWLRADRPDTKVRLWIEGESAGKPYKRVSDITLQTTWAERAVRASDLPPGGLDSVHLRFELLTPGSLWIDDLSVPGEPLSEPERRNARNALLAALQAYREKRFADFARLAGSHWARHPAAAPSDVDAPERLATDRGGLLRTGDSSALPQGRRLR